MGTKRVGGKTGGMTATVALAALVLAGLPTAGMALELAGRDAALCRLRQPHVHSGIGRSAGGANLSAQTVRLRA